MRIGASMQIDVAMRSAASVTPLMIQPDNLVAWYDARKGVTLSSASVSNDTTEATNAWTKVLCTRVDGQTDPAGGTSAVKITDTGDAGNNIHYLQISPTNLQSGPHLVDVWVAPGTLSYCRVRYGGTNAQAAIDMATATAVLGTECTRATLLAGSAGTWQKWRLEFTTVTNPLTIQTSTGPALADANYTGAGTGTLFIGTGSTYGPVLYQDRVSAWADQSGLGNHGTQGTAGSQPLFQCLDGSGLWVPSTALTNCRIGWPADVSKNLVSNLHTPFIGDSIPMTVIACGNRVGTNLGAPGLITLQSGGTAIVQTPRANGSIYASNYTDNVGLSKSGNYSSTVSTSLHTVSAVFDGANERLFVDGVADASNPQDRDVGTSTFTSALLAVRAFVFREISVYKTPLTDAERRAVENGMRARNGLAAI